MNRTLFRQSQYPVLQNRVYPNPEAARSCPRGDIEIVEDARTGLVYNAAFRPELLVYDASYDNEQGTSAVFQSHLEDVAGIVARQLGTSGLVEVGCGKGFFLELLLARGFDITGFDAAYTGDNPRITKRLFEPGIIASPASGLILRHVLEHIPRPVDFLFQLREANGGAGLIYIEVPCLDWILEHKTWFDIFYEHVNYFRLRDFGRMFGRVVESGRCFGGQYLYVVADLATLRVPERSPADAVHFPEDFLAGVGVAPAGSGAEGGAGCVWGGASKGVIFSLLRERMGLPVDAVIDINPAKQGRFLPATGLEVLSPETALARFRPGTPVYVMNSNYLTEIKQLSGNSFHYRTVDQ